MKQIEVVAAVIKNDDKILATQRGYGEFKGGWEFPGGKVEEGETPEQALIREIHEELMATIEVGEYLGIVEYDYPTFHLSMKCYMCNIIEGHLTLLEHNDARWLTLDNINVVNWLPADIKVIDLVEKFWECIINCVINNTA